MKINRHIFFVIALVAVTILAVAGSVQPVNAQFIVSPDGGTTEPVTPEQLIETVSIANTKIVSQSGNTLKISFDLANEKGVQADIRYSLMLANKKGTVVDQLAYKETIGMTENESIQKEISYTYPSRLPSGEYAVVIMIENSRGMTYDTAYAGNVIISAGADQYAGVQILPESCYLTVPGEAKSVRYSLTQGVIVSKDERLTLTCGILNQASSTVLMPRFETRIRSVFGEVVPGNNTEYSINAKAGAFTAIMEVPKPAPSQSYVSILILSDKSGKNISNPIRIYFTVSGASATIANVVFDKSAYKTGDVASIQLSRIDSSVIAPNSRKTSTSIDKIFTDILISRADGRVCGKVSEYELPQAVGRTNINVDITGYCPDPQATVTLFEKTDGGRTVLNVMSVRLPETRSAYQNFGYLAIPLLVLSVIILIIALIVHKRRSNAIKALMLLAIAVSAWQAFAGRAQAVTGYTELEYITLQPSSINGYNYNRGVWFPSGSAYYQDCTMVYISNFDSVVSMRSTTGVMKDAYLVLDKSTYASGEEIKATTLFNPICGEIGKIDYVLYGDVDGAAFPYYGEQDRMSAAGKAVLTTLYAPDASSVGKKWNLPLEGCYSHSVGGVFTYIGTVGSSQCYDYWGSSLFTAVADWAFGGNWQTNTEWIASHLVNLPLGQHTVLGMANVYHNLKNEDDNHYQLIQQVPFNVVPGGPVALNVNVRGTGTGRVTGDLNSGGISCANDAIGNNTGTCASSPSRGSTAVLTATSDAGSVFAGWTDGCTGSSNTCNVAMNGDKLVTATFNLPSRSCVVSPESYYELTETIRQVMLTYTVKSDFPGDSNLRIIVGNKVFASPYQEVYTSGANISYPYAITMADGSDYWGSCVAQVVDTTYTPVQTSCKISAPQAGRAKLEAINTSGGIGSYQYSWSINGGAWTTWSSVSSKDTDMYPAGTTIGADLRVKGTREDDIASASCQTATTPPNFTIKTWYPDLTASCTVNGGNFVIIDPTADSNTVRFRANASGGSGGYLYQFNYNGSGGIKTNAPNPYDHVYAKSELPAEGSQYQTSVVITDSMANKTFSASCGAVISPKLELYIGPGNTYKTATGESIKIKKGRTFGLRWENNLPEAESEDAREGFRCGARIETKEKKENLWDWSGQNVTRTGSLLNAWSTANIETGTYKFFIECDNKDPQGRPAKKSTSATLQVYTSVETEI